MSIQAGQEKQAGTVNRGYCWWQFDKGIVVMELGGIAIATTISMVALVSSVGSQPWQNPPVVNAVSPGVYAVPPDVVTYVRQAPSPLDLYLLTEHEAIQSERTPPLWIAQHRDSHHLRELIRRYNTDLSASDVREIAHWTEFYSQQYGIDPRLIAGLVARESGFDPKARSHSGARGLGQISTTLGKDLGIRDRYDIQENLEGTTRWIRTLYDTWLEDGVAESQAIHWSLASYRQGLARTREVGIPDNVARYINEVYEIANGLPHLPAS